MGSNARDSRPAASATSAAIRGRPRASLAWKSCCKSIERRGCRRSGSASDLSICRGLDYYTGTIYETFLTKLPGIGSVCSGGRYDNLAGLYTKQQLPGVGASLGLDRLLAGMEELNMLEKTTTPAPVFIPLFQAERLADYQRRPGCCGLPASASRFIPRPRDSGQQLQYAEKRGFRLALIAGSDEFSQGVWKIKDLARREEKTVPVGQLLSAVQAVVL